MIKSFTFFLLDLCISIYIFLCYCKKYFSISISAYPWLKYKNIVNICIFTLNSATVLSSCSLVASFFVDSISAKMIMSSVNKGSLNASFLIYM